MRNYKYILLFSILLFSMTLLFSACDSPPPKKPQKKQNIVTKKILPPAQKQKPVQPASKQGVEQVKKTNQVESQKPKNQKSESIKPDKAKKIDTAKNQQKVAQPENKLNKKQAPVEKTMPENLAVSENLQKELEDDKKKNYYSSDGKIDPFMSPIRKRATVEKKVVNRKLSPLEKLDLSQLKLVAIINMQSKGKNIAMVQESTGKGYMVKVGTYIGRNNGRIIEIKNDEIILKESIKNFNGVFEDLIKTIKLQKKDNG